MTLLQDKTIFITGASSGIGAACARHFAQYGAKLLLCARRMDLLNALAKELSESYDVAVHAFHLDLRQYASVTQALQMLPEEWKTIDILVNNAGLAVGLESLQEGNVEDWEAMIDTNFKGLLYVTREVLPAMVARN